MVRAYSEAKKRKIKLIVGIRLVTIDGFEVIAYPTDRAAYGRLCRLVTAGNLKAKKGECHLTFEEILGAGEGQMLIALPPLQMMTSPCRGEVAARSAADGGDAASRLITPPRPLRGRPSPSRGGFGIFTERLTTLARAAPGWQHGVRT